MLYLEVATAWGYCCGYRVIPDSELTTVVELTGFSEEKRRSDVLNTTTKAVEALLQIFEALEHEMRIANLCLHKAASRTLLSQQWAGEDLAITAGGGEDLAVTREGQRTRNRQIIGKEFISKSKAVWL